MVDDPHYEEAIQRFRALMARVESLSLKEPAAMSLATADEAGQVSVRIVLLRGLDERGFAFYTNSTSCKGRQLAANPQAALCFYWDQLAEQVRVEGRVEKVASEESNAYWIRRPRLSQLAATISDQSSVLADRETFERQIAELDEKLSGQPVPRPDHWFGYRVVPARIEFWEGRPGRIHVRTVYEQQDESWRRFLIYP